MIALRYSALKANGESKPRAVIVELLIRLIAADVARAIRDVTPAAVRINHRGAIPAVSTVPAVTAHVNLRHMCVMMMVLGTMVGSMRLSCARKKPS